MTKLINASATHLLVALGAVVFAVLAGPWVESKAGDRVEMYARHQCHPFWVTETRLAQVVVP